MGCNHTLAERETACADGLCPICLKSELAKAQAENQTLRNAQKACEDCDAPTIGEFKQLKAENARLAAETTRLLDALIAADYILGRVQTVTLKGDDNPPKYHWGEAADLVHSTLFQYQLEYAASQPQKPDRTEGIDSLKAENARLAARLVELQGCVGPPSEWNRALSDLLGPTVELLKRLSAIRLHENYVPFDEIERELARLRAAREGK